MKKKLQYILITLLFFTIVMSFFSYFEHTSIVITFIVILSLIKFWLVSFYFMELRKAHVFWKMALLAYGMIIGGAFIILLQ